MDGAGRSDLRLVLAIDQGVDFGGNHFGSVQRSHKGLGMTVAAIKHPQRSLDNSQDGVAAQILLLQPSYHLQQDH